MADTDDRISNLPDTVLCHILSFLPTKKSVKTSVLSKRWKLIWRSVPVLDIDDRNYNPVNEIYPRFNQRYHCFIRSVYGFISHDLNQPLQRFCLNFSKVCDPINTNAWLVAASQLGVEHVDFSFTLNPKLSLSSTVFMCNTLQVLKLTNVLLSLKSCSVDLCRLKILHLSSVTFLTDSDFAELLSGCPNLEDLEVTDLIFRSFVVKTKFIPLRKLVRTHIFTLQFPLEVVRNVECLRINWMDPTWLIPEFQHLTHLKFFSYVNNVVLVLDLLKHCPKLQILSIRKGNSELFAEGDEGYPQNVPLCISLHLKTCTFTNYEGSKGDFRFVEYVMKTAKYLQTMTISSNKDFDDEKKVEMFKSLSLLAKCSANCELSFE